MTPRVEPRSVFTRSPGWTCGFAKGLDNLRHRFPRENTGNVMRDRRHDLAPPSRLQFSENQINERPANVRKSIAVEEKERSAPMALPQELYRFGEGADFGLPAAPLRFNRCIAL